MAWLIEHATSIQILCGAAVAAWAFLSKVDKTYRQHLKEDLASKSDLALVAHQISRVETKLDDILLDGFRQSTGRRYAKPRSKKRARTVA